MKKFKGGMRLCGWLAPVEWSAAWVGAAECCTAFLNSYTNLSCFQITEHGENGGVEGVVLRDGATGY